MLALQPYSEVRVLPMTIAPAVRSLATTGASRAGRGLGNRDPLAVGRSAVWTRSLTDTVTPSNGRSIQAAAPASAIAASAARACSSTSGPATATNAPNPAASNSWMAPRTDVTRSTTVHSRARRDSRARRTADTTGIPMGTIG